MAAGEGRVNFSPGMYAPRFGHTPIYMQGVLSVLSGNVFFFFSKKQLRLGEKSFGVTEAEFEGRQWAVDLTKIYYMHVRSAQTMK